MRSKIILIAVLFVLCLSQASWAIDLNAPAIKNVTVESEIRRGYDAFESIYYRKLGVSGDTAEIAERIIDINKQQKTDTDGFCLGLYFNTWFNLDADIEVEKMTKSNWEQSERVKMLKEKLIFYYQEYCRLQKILNVDNEKVRGIIWRIDKPKSNGFLEGRIKLIEELINKESNQ